MSKHTKGPWVVIEDADIAGSKEPDWVTAGTYEFIQRPVGGTFSSGESSANARLIAAAPELLEAVMTYHNAAMAGRDPDKTMMDRAAAAIAKATGKEATRRDAS